MNAKQKKIIGKYDKDCKSALKSGEISKEKSFVMCCLLKDHKGKIEQESMIGNCFECDRAIVYRKYNRSVKHKFCIHCLIKKTVREKKKEVSYIG